MRSRTCAGFSQLDLLFLPTGCKSVIIRYVGPLGRCPLCKNCYLPPAIKRLEKRIFGSNLISWVVYHRIVLRLSYRLISKAVEDLFHETLVGTQAEQLVAKSAREHARTEARLLERLLWSWHLHLDETKISIRGVQQYVWVITNGNHVVLRLSETRETHMLRSLLDSYKGVIVTDFYAGYDNFPCRQHSRSSRTLSNRGRAAIKTSTSPIDR